MEYDNDEFVIIELDVSEYQNFVLEKAVCNHGFFMMAPNKWLPETKTLQRPIRLRKVSILVSITQSPNAPLLLIRVHASSVTPANRRIILHQVRRMLRLSERDEKVIREFQETHEGAKENGFGRLFRSVSLFEDMVKSILLCCCIWSRTLEMVSALCNIPPFLASNAQQNISNLKKSGDKRKRENNVLKNFPTAEEVLMVDREYLKKECKLGYRVDSIRSLAEEIQHGKLNLDELEKEISHEPITKRILKLDGVGPYTCSNILMCLGFYHQIPIDSETRRLLVKKHGKEDCTIAKARKYVEEIYGKYEPFQCLAFWIDMLNDYESKAGKLSELPSDCYPDIGGMNVDKVRKREI